MLDLLLATCKLPCQLRYDLIGQHCGVLTFFVDDDGRPLNIDGALGSSETRRHVHGSSNEDNEYEDVDCVPFVLRSSVKLYVGIMHHKS